VTSTAQSTESDDRTPSDPSAEPPVTGWRGTGAVLARSWRLSFGGRSAGNLGGRLAGFAVAAAWGLVGCAVMVGLWQLAALASADVPGPADGARALGRLLADPFYDRGANDKGVAIYLATSLQRVFAGFALAGLVGIPIGLVVGANRPAWLAINPVVQVLAPVSPLAWYPLLLGLLRDAGQASVFVIFITSLWPTLISTAAGAANVPTDQRNVARVFRFTRIGYVRHVLIPNALPSMITGLRLSMATAWLVIVAAEMLSGNSGIGFFVWDTYNAGNLPNVTAAIIVIGVVGLILDTILLRVARWVRATEAPA
jgi:nitrate/nitrite transport system permease protein